MSDIRRGNINIRGFRDAEMDFQLLRQMGSSFYRAASVGECLNTAHRIGQGTPKDWIRAFERLAEWQKKDGLQRLQQNHIVSGRDQLLKACNTFRAAEYYSPTQTSHHRSLGRKSVDCFKTAIGTMDVHFESHTLAYQNIELPVYFISPANDGKKRRTLLIVSGFDGTMEESFFMNGLAGLERNYNIILFAGPGQMDIFRYCPSTYFQPDFEHVVSSIIDFFAYRDEVDMDTLALLGISLGGYFAIRSAAHEPRVKALIANSPILDMHAYLASFTGMDPADMPDSEDFTLADIPHIPEAEFSPAQKEQSAQLITRFGQYSFKQTFIYLKEFKVGDALNQLQCSSLALIGEGEGSEPLRQYELFAKQTGAEQYCFSDFEGASTHCQLGNLSFANAVIYDWLDLL